MNAPKVLFAWIGNADLKGSLGELNAGEGPIAGAVEARNFDRLVLLSNYLPVSRNKKFVNWLGKKTKAEIELTDVELDSPTNFAGIYKAAIRAIEDCRRQHPASVLTFHLSPGTPAMAAVWILIAKTQHGAELLESSREAGVKTAEVPFNIEAEFIPQLLEQSDTKARQLSEARPRPGAAFDSIIGKSDALQRAILKAQKVAPKSVPVLIEGESGTGKELFASAIHAAGPRARKSFIAVNCGAIPKDLMESEFFGHKKGAFTGATANRNGHFREADGGTLFLDEIGELPLEMQVRLLRVLQEKEVVPVGESEPVKVDVRIIAATNKKLANEVVEGRFREDLFYRLAVLVIKLPPLRERSGDLPRLIKHLLEIVNAEAATEPDWQNKKLSPKAKNLLLRHHWPGNVRELQNTLTRAHIYSYESTIREKDIREALLETALIRSQQDILGQSIENGIDLQELINTVARHYLERAMDEVQGTKTKAAELLGLPSYQTLNNWLKKYSVEEN